MKDRTKNIVITIGFIVILFSMLIINVIKEDEEISETERRKLAQFPEFTLSQLFNGDLTEKLEKCTTDQFIARDFFRKIKSYVSIKILKQKDSNNLFEKDGAIYKMDYPLKEKNIESSANKINETYEKYFKQMNVYYAIIPDKNYYLENDDHLKIDYNKCNEITKEKLKDLKQIDISKELNIDDYYKTDLHWKQENISKVVNKIQKEMNIKSSSNILYEKKEVGDFYGTYYGQLGLSTKPDKLYILTNDTINNCITYNYENNKKGKIYDKSNSKDLYDIYVSGATAIISIENPNANTEKELLLFRDSFGSSIAPLLIENYKKITLIDLRYVSNKILKNYIEINNQDVLFLYSTTVLNQNILK